MESSEAASLNDLAWYDTNSEEKVHAMMQQGADGVPIRRRNLHKLYDVYGNAWEWTADWFGSYLGEPQLDPWGPPLGVFRMIRGRSFSYGAARASFRTGREPGLRLLDLGFRVRVPPSPHREMAAGSSHPAKAEGGGTAPSTQLFTSCPGPPRPDLRISAITNHSVPRLTTQP